MDELTDWEKLVQSTNQLATLVHEYYKALLLVGFPPKQALDLSIAYQNKILDSAQAKKG